jgi:hypothetical protein
VKARRVDSEGRVTLAKASLGLRRLVTIVMVPAGYQRWTWMCLFSLLVRDVGSNAPGTFRNLIV